MGVGGASGPALHQRQLARPRWHSLLQRTRHDSFQAGTWCTPVHTTRWQASVQASGADTPHTVTQVWGVTSCVHTWGVGQRGVCACEFGSGGKAARVHPPPSPTSHPRPSHPPTRPVAHLGQAPHPPHQPVRSADALTHKAGVGTVVHPARGWRGARSTPESERQRRRPPAATRASQARFPSPLRLPPRLVTADSSPWGLEPPRPPITRIAAMAGMATAVPHHGFTCARGGRLRVAGGQQGVSGGRAAAPSRANGRPAKLPSAACRCQG